MKKKIILLSKYLICCVLIFVLLSNLYIEYSYNNLIYSSTTQILEPSPVLILGTSSKMKSGKSNLFFSYRMKAGIKLWNNKKASHFIVSGDNHTKGYDEAKDMKNALIKGGVPSSKITCDYAGFRTFDSIERAKKVFGLKKVIVVSQEFHNERALFLADKLKIKASAYNAKTPPAKYSITTHIREIGARTKAVLDIYLLRTSSKFLGEHVGLIDN